MHELRAASAAEASGIKKAQLIDTLQRSGLNPIALSNRAGVTVLVLPYGGRILGLYGAESEFNFLWTNPALGRHDSACALFSSDGWHNTGGDRTWLAPELDFFFPAFPDTSTYAPPRQLDAAQYAVTAVETKIQLETELSIRSYRDRVDLPLRITKSIAPVDDPLRKRRLCDTSELEFAGYRLGTWLQMLETQPSDTMVSIWTLLQLPAGGELLAPTYHEIQPTVFFGTVPESDLRVEQRLIRYRMHAAGEQKISIPAVSTTGRIGYAFRDRNRHVLIVRSFAVDVSGDYRDVRFADPNDDGYAVQACNINSSSLGRFAELEYHAPAIGGRGGRRQIEDASCVWAYSGGGAAIRTVARILLGADYSY